MHAPLDTLSSTFTKSTCKGQAWWAASINIAGISWWHATQVEQGSMDMTQSMKHQVEGPIMQEKEGMRAFGRCNSWSARARKCRGEMIVLEESRGGEEPEATQAGRPRPAGLPYLRSPPAPVFCRQASLSFLSLCVQVCVPRTSVDIAHLHKLDSSKKSTTLIHSKSTSRSNILSA
jgi:hypothetical protein